jgi:hypothetical protein
MSVEEMLSNLERRAAALRDEEAFHTRQEAHHRAERESRAAELEKVQASLEAFRTAAATAAGLTSAAVATPIAGESQKTLPPTGRLMVSRLLRSVVESSTLAEPFGANAVAAEANRRFADRLPAPVGPRTASDVLRRMLAEGAIQLVRKGKASHEALYRRGT